ncbi:MAG: hypothetical protein J7K47_05485 [Thermoplasmata archaeon]|nr:hypothetical protein [Thermoplasmata archaeon]
MKVKNGILKGELKVKGGKLIKCTLELDEGKIKRIKITGDFFMYPEDAIEKLEKALQGIQFDEKEISRKVKEALNGVELIGATMEDFVDVIINVG